MLIPDLSLINLIPVYSKYTLLICSSEEQAAPRPVSPSGNMTNSVQAEGNSNSSLGQLGEEEEKLQQEKNLDEGITTALIIHADDKKVVDPDVMLCGSISPATAPLSFDSVTKTTETIDISGPIATASANRVSDDTGSGDSRMNSDGEPLLETYV